MPVDRECIVSVASKDVIHHLSLHPMRIQQDAIPGSVSDMWFKPISTGRWQTICGQLCGAGHGGMVGYMEVMQQEDFDSWYKENVPKPKDEKVPAAESGDAEEPPKAS